MVKDTSKIYKDSDLYTSIKKNESDEKKNEEKELKISMDKLLKDLKNVNLIAQDFVTNTYVDLDTSIQSLLKTIDPEIANSENMSIENVPKIKKIANLINKLNNYVSTIDEKIYEHQLLRQELYRLGSVEKGIVRYAPEVLLKNEHFFSAFFEYNWLKYFFMIASFDMYGWLKEFHLKFNENYHLIIGSINCRIVGQFVYPTTEVFFNNTQLQNKITAEYYGSLNHSLGNFIKIVLNKMIVVKNKHDASIPIVSIDQDTKEKINFSRKKIDTANYTLCFSTINNSNRGLRIVLLTCDYLIQASFLKLLLNSNQHFRDNLQNFINYIDSEEPCSLTNAIYIRWLLWATFYLGRVIGSDWISCKIECNATEFNSKLNSALVKQLKFLETNNKDVFNSSFKELANLTIYLRPVKQTYETSLKTEKIYEYKENPNQYPNIDDFIIETMEDRLNKHIPHFYNHTETDIYKCLETKFILLNKISSSFSSSLLYNFEKNDKTFSLVDIDKTELVISFV